MDNVDTSMINELFVQKLDSREGLEKLAQAGSSFVRQKIREHSFARKILPPQYVTRAELQRSINHDGLVRIVDKEPDSKAMIVNFRGNGDFNYIEGDRFEIPFFRVTSQDFQKTEEELLAYEMPLTEVIERNSVLDIEAQEDGYFLQTVDAAVSGENSAVGGNYASNGAVEKEDMMKLFNVLDANKLKTEVILMDTEMFNRFILYTSETFGDGLVSEITINGYTHPTLFGRRLVVSNKNDLLKDKIYAFAAPDYMGRFYILSDVKFWIDKRKNIITFSTWASIGMGLGNTKAVARLDLSA
jgi:hypothetical protein